MKTRPLKNYKGSIGCEVYDFDYDNADPEEIVELGKIVEANCTVFINSSASRKRLHEIQSHWGDPGEAVIHDLIGHRRLSGPHWRGLLLNLGLVARDRQESASGEAMAPGMSQVSFVKDKKGRPTGAFANGELNWHHDQPGFTDAPRTIGLSSLHDTKNSQTDFLQTHDAWNKLSSTLQSEIKEMKIIHKWRPDWFAGDLIPSQRQMSRYNAVPLDGMETMLYNETASGIPGIRFPAFSFGGIVGMSDLDAWKLYSYLSQIIYDPDFVYQCHWEDGQTVYFDQSISLHRRPTNILDGNKRTITRIITYMNKLYPDARNQPTNSVFYKGEEMSIDDFAELVDADRIEEFKKEKEKK